MDRSNKGLRYFLTLLFAILLHLWILKYPLPPEREDADSAASRKNREIVVEPYHEPGQKPVVRSSRAKENLAQKDKPADYNGEFTNRVEKQTRSPLRGRFSEGELPKGGGGDGDATAENGEPGGSKAGPRGLGMRDLLAFGATPNELAKEIVEGSETVLNTDRYLFASFINRLADEIYDPWVANAREAVHGLYLSGRKLESNTYVTRLQVVLNNKGNITAIQTVKSSGVMELDEATKKAFWDREPFPNPPDEMFKSDGAAHFVYEFHFEWKTSSFNILPGII